MIKDVSVLLDGSSEDELRLRHAEVIATGSGAHLTGLFLNPLAELAAVMPIDGGGAAAQLVADLDEGVRRQGDVVRQRLSERFSRLSVPSEIRRIDAPPGELVDRAVSEARWSDLFVTSRPYDNGLSKWKQLFEALLFESGRGIYVVPPGRQPADVIRRILVAWRDTRETARAVAEATPLIEKAPRTAVVLVNPEMGTADAKREPGMDIARHLNRHGTAVEIVMLESETKVVSDVLLEQAGRMSADLIVMGAYGHSRAREWVLGGTTVEMLDKSEFPILLAH